MATIAEYDGAGAMLARYAFGGMGEPLVPYDSAGTRSWMMTDERGSIVAMSDGSGNAILKNTYDEYGKPGAANGGRFLYTGQMYVPEAAAYWYKTRMYEPALGRFLQTDPIGYDGGMNLYAYVGNDPLNATDPTGLTYTIPGNGGFYECDATAGCEWHGDITVVANLNSISGWLFRDVLGSATRLLEPSFPELTLLELGASITTQDCSTPPLTDAERSASNSGNRGAFWASRFKRGDPYGAIGLTVYTNSSILGQEANLRLRQAITNRSPKMRPGAVTQEVQRFGVELMQGYVALLNRGPVSTGQFAGLHFALLENHSLPRSTFGGAPVTGTSSEANVTANLWKYCP